MSIDKIIADIVDTSWEPIGQALVADGQAWVKMTLTSNGLVMEALTRDSMHCATCQCNKLHDDTPRVPGNPGSRTWHR